MSCNFSLVMVSPNRVQVDGGGSDRSSHCDLCMMSSVVRKVFAPGGGFFLQKVLSTGFFRDQVWAHLFRI